MTSKQQSFLRKIGVLHIRPRGIMIPQAALIADQEGVYVFVVEDGKAVAKRVKPGGEHGTIVVIESGLSAGDQVIVQGLDGVRPGIAVRASPLPQALRQG